MVTQLVKKFPALYGTRRFITVFTRARHWSLSWSGWIQSKIFKPISLRSILIYSHLRLNLASGLFPSGFPIWVTRLTHLILLAFITLTILVKRTTYEAPYSAVSFNLLLGPNILLSTLFSNTLYVCSSRCMKDWVSHPNKTRGKIILNF